MTRDTLQTVRGEVFDVASVRADIEEIALHLGDYLARCGGWGSSKHSALGAVGKALRAARSLRGDALLGYSRRIHEQATGNSFPVGDVESLDDGLRKLDRLLGNQPSRAGAQILDRVEHATYFDVRRRRVEFERAWADFARNAQIVKPGEKAPWFSKKLGTRGAEWEAATKAFLEARRAEASFADHDLEGEK